MLETIQLSHIPPHLPLYITVYQSLQNATFLRQQLLAGNADFEYAFIDASMIVSRNHVLAACFRVLNDYVNGRLKSRNVHSEIVFALSGNNNIGEAFRKFGIQDNTTDLLVIKIPVPSVTPNPGAPISSPPTTPAPAPTTTTTTTITKETIQTHLNSSIQGTPIPFTDENLSGICDVVKVQKTYKIPSPASATSKAAEAKNEAQWGREKKRLEKPILGAIALRGAT